MSSRRLSDLTPDTRAAVEAWVAACAARGVDILVYCTLRTAEEQSELYASGRTAHGPILTNAPAWQSWHQFGRAVDAVPMVGGKCLWRYDGDVREWEVFAEEAEHAGLEWAGHWRGFREYVHVQLVPVGMTLASAYREAHPDEATA